MIPCKVQTKFGVDAYTAPTH